MQLPQVGGLHYVPRSRNDRDTRDAHMKIKIWSDIACPWCFVGKHRFERALEDFPQRDELDVVWRSFELDPAAPAVQPGSQAELLAAKYRVPLPRPKP